MNIPKTQKSTFSEMSVFKALLTFTLMLSVCFFANIQKAYPLPANDPGDGGGTTIQDKLLKCIEDTQTSYNVSPQTIDLNGSVTLSWSVSPPARCGMLKQVRINGQTYELTGSVTLQPTVTTEYRFGIVIPGGISSFGAATVTVNLPNVIYINGNTLEWKRLLVRALGAGGKKIVLAPNLDMDLSGFENITVAGNTHLTSELPHIVMPDITNSLNSLSTGFVSNLSLPKLNQHVSHVLYRPLARDFRNLGPRLYTTTRPAPLFVISGDDVVFEGFRLHGADYGSTGSMATGIRVSSVKNISITNMEISGWGNSGISYDNQNPELQNTYAIKIINNFIHHNQHEPGGFGYGIVISGAYALIERNVFDFNRHAIAGGRKPGTGYLAQFNLILKGGGVHCWDGPWGVDFFCGHTHQFDQHGDKNYGTIQVNGKSVIGCWGVELLNNKRWNCGIAGDFIKVNKNAFQYTSDQAFKLRGWPKYGAEVSDNIYAHDDEDDAFEQELKAAPSDAKRMQKFGNASYDSYGKYGVCDFDGDGIDDLFLATGKTWWFSSYGEFHWTYLSEHNERLAQVRLGYFDDDKRCDVLTESDGNWVVSSGGKGAWQGIGNFGAPLKDVVFGRFDSAITDFEPGVTRRTTHAFWRLPDGEWKITELTAPNWQHVGSSSFPMNKLRFGDFTGDGVTDVLAVQGGRWSISKSGIESWQKLNPYLSDDVRSLLVADLNHNNIDDLIKLNAVLEMSSKYTETIKYTWWISDDGRSRWRKLKSLSFTRRTDIRNPPLFALAGRFGAAPGGGVLLSDYNRVGHFYSEAEIAAGANPEWTSLYSY